MMHLLGGRSIALMQGPYNAEYTGYRHVSGICFGRVLSVASPCKGMATMATQQTSAYYM